MIFNGFIKTDLVNYPGKVASAVFTSGCNFHCPYCHNPELVTLSEAPAEEIYSEDEVLAHLRRRGPVLEGLVISGGEPLIYSSLPAFIRKVRKTGKLVKLDTNGSLPDALRALLDEKLLDYVAMDVKAPADKYGMVGFPHGDAILESIGILKKSGVEHEFRTTCPKGLLDREDFPKMAEMIGPDSRWYLQVFNPSKTLDLSYGYVQPYSREELSEIIAGYGLKNTFVR